MAVSYAGAGVHWNHRRGLAGSLGVAHPGRVRHPSARGRHGHDQYLWHSHLEIHATPSAFGKQAGFVPRPAPPDLHLDSTVGTWKAPARWCMKRSAYEGACALVYEAQRVGYEQRALQARDSRCP